MFLIATEGAKTEPQYFACFNAFNEFSSTVHVKCIRKRQGASSPQHVLKAMKQHLADNNIKNSDEAWLVIDKDRWTELQLGELHTWSQEKKNYRVALSNPKFEYWLLLHFENIDGNLTSTQCTNKLRRHLPQYDKRLECSKITLSRIQKAVQQARQQDNSPCDSWPQTTGTTVYRLVERIISAGDA